MELMGGMFLAPQNEIMCVLKGERVKGEREITESSKGLRL